MNNNRSIIHNKPSEYYT